ncbi:MAG: thiol:disulfide interchange protein DsbA/DsbL [Gammaproteobacteria bacterium]|nr:thiol:disulfide interchange protein DsbA/DsbL [Gammaproteobacteria bacterium]
MAQRRKTPNVTLVRNAILGAIALIVFVILGYSILYTLGVLDPNRGELYVTIPDREIKSDPIEVIEFFSYACPNCKELHTLLAGWERSLPDDVTLREVHVAHSLQTTNLARTHVTLGQRNVVSQNQRRIFEEVEKRPQTFGTLESTAEFFDGHGIEKDQFERIAESDRVQSLLDADAEFVRELGVIAVPTFLVANKYVVRSRTTQQETVRALKKVIEMVRSGELPLAENAPDAAEEANGDESEGPSAIPTGVPVDEPEDSGATSTNDPEVEADDEGEN